MPHSTSTCFTETKSEAWVVFIPDGFPQIEQAVVCSVDFSTLIFGCLTLDSFPSCIPQSEDGGWCHVQSLLLNPGNGGYFHSYLSNQVVKSQKAENSLSIKNPNCRQSWGSVFWWSAESKVVPLCITLNLRVTLSSSDSQISSAQLEKPVLYEEPWDLICALWKATCSKWRWAAAPFLWR